MPKNATFSSALGLTLRHLRETAGVSQESLAAKAGVHRTFVGLVERGRRDPGMGNVDRLLGALGVSWEEFGEKLDRSRQQRSSARGSRQAPAPKRQ